MQANSKAQFPGEAASRNNSALIQDSSIRMPMVARRMVQRRKLDSLARCVRCQSRRMPIAHICLQSGYYYMVKDVDHFNVGMSIQPRNTPSVSTCPSSAQPRSHAVCSVWGSALWPNVTARAARTLSPSHRLGSLRQARKLRRRRSINARTLPSSPGT